MKGLFGKVLSKAFEHADNIFREASAALNHHQLNYIHWNALNYLIQPDLSSRKPALLNESIWEFYRVLYHYVTFANWIKLYIYIIQISHICEVQCSRKSLMDGIFCRPFRATVEPPRTRHCFPMPACMARWISQWSQTGEPTNTEQTCMVQRFQRANLPTKMLQSCSGENDSETVLLSATSVHAKQVQGLQVPEQHTCGVKTKLVQ